MTTCNVLNDNKKENECMQKQRTKTKVAFRNVTCAQLLKKSDNCQQHHWKSASCWIVYTGHQSNPVTRHLVDVENIVVTIGQKVAISQQSLWESFSLPVIGQIEEMIKEDNIEW
uniref:Uncharacterized protein n=1 Tax=Romanomermis culicivorax TaxID=13658 RepID=A0A915I7I9_ROMCU